MAYSDDHHDRRHGDWRMQDEPGRQPGDARGAQRGHHGGDLAHNDPVQRSYGRAGAPDVHGAPGGGYRRDADDDAERRYGTPGYMRHAGDRWHDWDARSDAREETAPYGLHRDSWRGHGGRTLEEERYRERYQGGSGGPRSNRNPYAGSQTYGGYGDQLGYGSYEEDGRRHAAPHDPDYLRWREQQLRALDADYQSWRGERYKKFSEEFDSWRKNRQGTAPSSGDSNASAPSAKPGKPASGSGS